MLFRLSVDASDLLKVLCISIPVFFLEEIETLRDFIKAYKIP